MADEEGEERTEEASPRKREEMREQGRVAKSGELVSALLMLATTGVFYGAANWTFKGLGSLFESSFLELGKTGLAEWTPQTVVSMLHFAFKAFAWVVAPVACAGLVAGVAGNIFQFGFMWTTKPLEPDFNKLNPMNGLGRIFSLDGVFEFFKAGIKFAIVGTILYIIFKRWVGEADVLWDADASTIALTLGKKVIRILMIIAGAMAVMSAADFAFQKFRFEKRIMMTKQEVREERKQMDGNPQIKARIRSIQRKFATSKMIDAVKKADVVITNPTHFAIALVYDRETMFAPKIVAKGMDHMAQRIKQVARENGVPCVENVPLARALYKAMKVGQFIQRDLFNAVAEVLAYVYRLRGRKL
ncbi:MAG: flagellar biosynthesis protein FlhB [Bdellovibrionota bacterium]